MENDADFQKNQREIRRKRRRVWLSSVALFFCVLMMVNLVSQARAVTPEIKPPDPVASDLADPGHYL